MSGAVVVIRQNRALRRFREAGATSPETARTLAELGERESWVLRRMAERGVFVPVTPDRYYLDESAAARFLQRRRRIVLFFLALGAAGLLWLLLR